MNTEDKAAGKKIIGCGALTTSEVNNFIHWGVEFPLDFLYPEDEDLEKSQKDKEYDELDVEDDIIESDPRYFKVMKHMLECEACNKEIMNLHKEAEIKYGME